MLSTSTSRKKSPGHTIASSAAIVRAGFLLIVHSGGICTDKVLDKDKRKQKRNHTLAAYRNLPSWGRDFLASPSGSISLFHMEEIADKTKIVSRLLRQCPNSGSHFL